MRVSDISKCQNLKLWKCKYIPDVLETLSGLNWLQPIHTLSSMGLHPLAVVVPKQAPKTWKGAAKFGLSSALIASRVLNLEW